jgi:hypothetical protein
MASSGMLLRVDLVRTNVSEELSASIIGLTRIGDLGTTSALTNNRRTLRENINSIQFFIIYVPSQQPQGQLQTQHSTDIHNYIMDTTDINITNI